LEQRNMTHQTVPLRIEKLSGGKHGWIFGGPPAENIPAGYVVEEFLLGGEAVRYQTKTGGASGPDGHWDVEPGEAQAYVTRAYVARPKNRADFNGVAIVNWQNVTAGFDLGTPIEAEFFRGYAWVGVTTQKIGVDGMAGLTVGLREWDSERYGDLRHPGDAWSYDIFAQAGRAIRDGALLDGMKPSMMLAAGASQSAMRLASYLNGVHATDRVYDGFHLSVHWGLCPPIDEPPLSLVAAFTPLEDGSFPWTCAIRDDNGVPVLVVATECESRHNFLVRQPDTDTFRFWEVAGGAHLSPSTNRTLEVMVERDGMTRTPSEPDRNTIEWGYVNGAAIRALTAWARDGKAPASMPRIEFAGGAAVRDGHGNVRGGVRVPEMEAPVATYHGEREMEAGLTWLQGRETPFAPSDHPTPQKRNQDWEAAVDRLVAAGVLLKEDAPVVCAQGKTGA
jgi:hypothetical protein